MARRSQVYYSFGDFVRLGVPLTLVVCVVVALTIGCAPASWL